MLTRLLPWIRRPYTATSGTGLGGEVSGVRMRPSLLSSNPHGRCVSAGSRRLLVRASAT
jgi:hypothetical protein